MIHNMYLMTRIELNEKKIISYVHINHVHEWYNTLMCIVYIVVSGDT